MDDGQNGQLTNKNRFHLYHCTGNSINLFDVKFFKTFGMQKGDMLINF